MSEVKLAPEIEERGKDKYGTPVDDVRTYVSRVIDTLQLDNDLVNDTDSAMYAWRLNHQSSNVEVAQEVLNMQGASLSALARAMADADEETRRQIESDNRYHIKSPRV